jgi:hypothetical protein
VPSAAQAKAAADIAWMRANTLSQIEKWEG